MKQVSRKEDMSPDGELQVTQQEDGDLIVTVFQKDPRSCVASVEFCIGASGGGGSSRTHKALLALAKAMAEDNVSGRCSSRRGRATGKEFLPKDPVTGQIKEIDDQDFLG